MWPWQQLLLLMQAGQPAGQAGGSPLCTPCQAGSTSISFAEACVLTNKAVYVLRQLGEGEAQLGGAFQEGASATQLPDIEAAHRVGAADRKQIIVGQVPHAGARPAGSSSRLTDSISTQAVARNGTDGQCVGTTRHSASEHDAGSSSWSAVSWLQQAGSEL